MGALDDLLAEYEETEPTATVKPGKPAKASKYPSVEELFGKSAPSQVRAEAEQPSMPVAPQPDKLMRIKQTIERGMLPEPTVTDKLKAALSPSEVAGDLEAAAARVNDRVTAGVLPKAMEATGLVAPGRFAQLERERPVASAMGEFPAAAASLATGAPQLAGKAGAALVGRLGGKALPAAARTVAGGGAAGGIFGTSDQAIRSAGELGGQPGPITSDDLTRAATDVGSAGLMGTATGGLMSALPGALSSVENFAHKRVLGNDLRPIKQMSKKGTLDKSLLQFGKDNPEEGAKAMAEFVDRENLGPVFRKKGFKMETEFNKRMNQSWEEGAGPVIEKAFAIEPKASANMPEIEAALQKLAPKKGTPDSLLVNKAIAKLKELQADTGVKGGKFPLPSLLDTARSFQAKGHAGVVNYDEPDENKEMARQIGRALKTLVNDKIGRIYAKHPDAAREILNQNPAFNDHAPPGIASQGKTTVADNLLTNPDVSMAGEKLRAGNERFSDYKKMERMVGEVGKAKAGEKKSGLIGHLLHGAGATAVGVGAGLINRDLILPAVAAYETGRIGYPYAMRGLESTARLGSGVPIDPRLRLTAPQLQALRDSPEAFREFRKKLSEEKQ